MRIEAFGQKRSGLVRIEALGQDRHRVWVEGEIKEDRVVIGHLPPHLASKSRRG